MKTLTRPFGKLPLLTVILAVSSLIFFWFDSTETESAHRPVRPADPPANYDIRLDQTKAARQVAADLASLAGKDQNTIEKNKKKLVRAADDLISKIPGLKIEYNPNGQTAEVISPESSGKSFFLTAPSNQKRPAILRDFLRQNRAVFGLDPNQIDDLKVTADYANPDGVLSFVHLEQRIGNIPVFAAEVKAGLNKNGRIIRIINNLAPDLSEAEADREFGRPEQAVRRAAGHIGIEVPAEQLKRVETKSDDLKTVFERDRFADRTTAEKMYFPLDSGVIRPAWRVLLWLPHKAFYVIVDASDGTLFWRKSLTEYQTQPATYNFYDDDSPTPFTPGPNNPIDPFEPPLIMRTTRTLIGNESPYDFNSLGWITDGDNITDGNNAIAGIDRDGINGVDPDGTATGNPNRTFSYTYNPAPGNPPPGDEPLPGSSLLPPSQFQQGSVTNAFYWVNRFHDETYLAGFTEQAFNFQNDNFGRGGLGGDKISVEVQDSAGINNSNFSTPADGTPPRAQFFIFVDPDPNLPDRDGALDTQRMIHEFTHGLSNRLHGNATGLGSNMSRGMGEGASDFYALCLLSDPAEPIGGLYPTGSYSVFVSSTASLFNRYRGIRRFPTAIRSSVGGPNNRPHNPITFADIDQTQVDYSDGAFPAPTAPHLDTNAAGILNIGELWTVALWEVRAILIQQHGAVEGNRRALNYITNGMKLSPLDPTLLQSRDGIIAAAAASDPPDADAVRQAFAIRGMGFSASVDACCGTTTTRVTEAFDLPNVVLVDPFSVSDTTGNGNGFPEPGENVLLTVNLTNPTGQPITNVAANINGGTNVIYGTINDGQTTGMQIPYSIPGDVPCGSFHQVTINITSDIGQSSGTREFRVGVPVAGPPVTFSNTTQIDVPSGQPTTTSGPAGPYPSTISVSGLSGQKTITVTLNSINHTWVGDADVLLEGPGGQKFIIMSDAFEANNRTGTVVSTLTIRDDAPGLMPSSGIPPTTGDFQPTNAGTVSDSFDAPAPAGPYQSPAPGGSATFASVFGTDGSTMNGDWKLWIDDDASGDPGAITGGWSISFEEGFTCVVCLSCPFGRARADFDGDGRTDISVFRPSEGNWYLNQSTGGFSVLNWGLSTDEIIPGDFDGDGRADPAIFRAESDSNLPDFYVLNSNGFTFSGYSWGLPGDVPVIGDFDGDGRSDPGVFRPSQNLFYVLESGTGNVLISRPMPSGTPVALDYDGDGQSDFATFSNGNWFISKSSDNHQSGELVNWGLSTDLLVPADYNGDGREDLAVFRPVQGIWYIRLSEGNNQIIRFGLDGDVPAPGDYDGDGQTDLAVYRNGVWYINQTASGSAIHQFGLNGDLPIPNRYLP
ncbi:MAG: M36 family metallopeptidase [Pyrinomonadaceae bacterium]